MDPPPHVTSSFVERTVAKVANTPCALFSPQHVADIKFRGARIRRGTARYRALIVHDGTAHTGSREDESNLDTKDNNKDREKQ
jgi:hypothetical protein